MDYESHQRETKPPAAPSSLYGTLPRRPKRTRRKEKKTPEEMAAMLAQYAVYQAEKNEALSILLSCRLYTKPLYVLKQLRNIWEREVHDDSAIGHVATSESNEIPVEFLTLRRRPNRRQSNRTSTASRPLSTKSIELDRTGEAFGSILADLKVATDRLAEGMKSEILAGMEQSRDSGFGSFSDSIISDTDESTLSVEADECPGYFPVTMTPMQRKLSVLLEDWLRASPGTFVDAIINKSLESFVRIITIHHPGASTWMASLNTNLVQAAQFRQSIRRNRVKYSGDYSLYNITNDVGEMVHHLTWIESTMGRHLSQDELISQLLNAESNARLEDYPNWRVNCQMFNCLTSATQYTVLQCSKTSECVKVINYLIEVAIGCCRSGNFNSAMAIALGLDAQPVRRLHKVWKKLDPAKIHILKNIGDPSNNFHNYREMYKLTRKMPLSIPYMSLLSKDIYYNTLNLTDQLCDIVSRSILITKQMREIRTSIGAEGGAGLNGNILKKIYGLTVKNDDDLYYMSYKLDAPQSAYEKEELKRLKLIRKSKLKF